LTKVIQVDISLKINKMTLSLQGRWLAILVANDKVHVFIILEFWKTWICHCALDSFLMLKDFPGEISEDINKCDFLGAPGWLSR